MAVARVGTDIGPFASTDACAVFAPPIRRNAAGSPIRCDPVGRTPATTLTQRGHRLRRHSLPLMAPPRSD
jgi:hypothetical protein